MRLLIWLWMHCADFHKLLGQTHTHIHEVCRITAIDTYCTYVQTHKTMNDYCHILPCITLLHVYSFEYLFNVHY